MRSIMAITTPQDHSLSFSKRHFHFKKTIVEEYDDDEADEEERSENMREMLKLNKSSSSRPENQVKDPTKNPSISMQQQQTSAKPPRKKLSILAVSKLKTSLALNKARAHFSSNRGTRVLIGTLFGHKRGHVLLSLHLDFKLEPSFLVELATPTSVLVREMASGLVRIALECEKKARDHQKKGSKNSNDKLIEEPFWRTYCNGKKCGYAIKRDCGVEEWKVLNAIGQTSMGAGVLPGAGHVADDEVMYMRAKFERVVGSKDSEAYYMMNPDGNGGGPELSVYLLRV